MAKFNKERILSVLRNILSKAGNIGYKENRITDIKDSILKLRSVGIDISDSTIEVCELIRSKDGIRIENFGRTIFEQGIVEHGRIKNKTKLAEKIREALAKASPNPINVKKMTFGLPEGQVFTHFFTADLKNHANPEKLVFEEAKNNIPINEKKLLYSYKVRDLSTTDMPGSKKEILLLAANIDVFMEWSVFFDEIGIEIDYFDIESLANFRSIYGNTAHKPVCIADIGSLMTNISIFDQNGLSCCFSSDAAGNKFDKLISDRLKIDIEEARMKKLSSEAKDSGMIRKILAPGFDEIIDEIKSCLEYYRKKKSLERGYSKLHESKIAEEIVLIGGSSRIAGIADYFQKQLNIPTRIGESVFLKGKNNLEYLESVGLALRGLEKKWDATDPHISTTCKNISSNIIIPKFKNETNQKIDISIKIIALLILSALFFLTSLYILKKINGQERSDGSKILTEKNSPAITNITATSDAPSTEDRTYEIKIPIATSKKLYNESRISGVIIENSISISGSYEDAIAYSKAIASKKINRDAVSSGYDWFGLTNSSENYRVLYKYPLYPAKEAVESDSTVQNRFNRTGKLSFKVGWVSYSPSEAKSLFISELGNLLQESKDYLLNNIEITSLEKSDNPDILYLTGKVDISLNKLTE